MACSETTQIREKLRYHESINLLVKDPSKTFDMCGNMLIGR